MDGTYPQGDQLIWHLRRSSARDIFSPYCSKSSINPTPIALRTYVVDAGCASIAMLRNTYMSLDL
jgi:hypothetical protein